MCYSIAPLLVDFTSLRHFIADFIPVLTSVQQIEATSEKFRSSIKKEGNPPVSLRNAHSYLSPQHNLYLLLLSHLFRIFYQDLPASPAAFCVLSKYLFRHSVSLFVSIQSKEL